MSERQYNEERYHDMMDEGDDIKMLLYAIR